MNHEQPPDAGALHNMSAPPRSTVNLRPLRLSPAPIEGTRAIPGRGPSGRFFARVHLVGLLCDGRSHVPRGRDIARSFDGAPNDLVDAVAILRTRQAGGARVSQARLACAEMPLTVLHDEFLDRVAALGDLGLPALLLARPTNLAVPTPRKLPPLAALRLIAGTAGGLFLRTRSPSGAHLLGSAIGASFDYYLPRGLAVQGEE